MTQNQLTELFESDQVKAIVERAEERGYLEPAELEAFSIEHELNEEEVEAFTRELETQGLDVRFCRRPARRRERAGRPRATVGRRGRQRSR